MSTNLKELEKFNISRSLTVYDIPWRYILKRNRQPLDSPKRVFHVVFQAMWLDTKKGYAFPIVQTEIKDCTRKNFKYQAAGKPMLSIQSLIPEKELQKTLDKLIEDSREILGNGCQIQQVRRAEFIEEII